MPYHGTVLMSIFLRKRTLFLHGRPAAILHAETMKKVASISHAASRHRFGIHFSQEKDSFFAWGNGSYSARQNDEKSCIHFSCRFQAPIWRSFFSRNWLFFVRRWTVFCMYTESSVGFDLNSGEGSYGSYFDIHSLPMC